MVRKITNPDVLLTDEGIPSWDVVRGTRTPITFNLNSYDTTSWTFDSYIVEIDTPPGTAPTDTTSVIADGQERELVLVSNTPSTSPTASHPSVVSFYVSKYLGTTTANDGTADSVAAAANQPSAGKPKFYYVEVWFHDGDTSGTYTQTFSIRGQIQNLYSPIAQEK